MSTLHGVDLRDCIYLGQADCYCRLFHLTPQLLADIVHKLVGCANDQHCGIADNLLQWLPSDLENGMNDGESLPCASKLGMD